MPEHLVPLEKESGGSTITWRGQEFTWPKDGSVTEVPYELACELLAIRDADFAVADEKKAEAAAAGHAVVSQSADHGHDGTEGRQVIEPGPGKDVAARMVTEPGPSPDREIAEIPKPPMSQASPLTPKPRGGTRKNPAAK
jgi:hypothetical protein